MSLMDEFKEERERIKYSPFKTKLEYIMDYYKWPIFAIILVIIILIGYIYTLATTKENILNGLLLNTTRFSSDYTSDEFQSLSNIFLQTKNLDKNKNEVTLDTSLNLTLETPSSNEYTDIESYMAIMNRVTAGSVDFIIADLETLQNLAYREYFTDLSTVLSEEDYSKYEPYFLYIDQSIINELYGDDNISLNINKNIIYPDCNKPEDMKQPIPVLINMEQSDAILDIYNHPTDSTIAFGITLNVPHTENTIDFLNFITK